MTTQTSTSRFLEKPLLVAIGVFVAGSIVTYFTIDFGFLSVVTVFVLLQLFFSELTTKAIERILGPTLAAALIIMVLLIFRHHFAWMMIITSLLVMVFVYCYAIGFFPYSMILGAITIGLVSAMDLHGDVHRAIQLGLHWVGNLLLGCSVVLILDFFASRASDQPHKKQPMVLQKQINYKAVLISCRVVLTFLILLFTNRAMGWSFIDIQAIIAGIIVSAQHSLSMTHQRAVLRLLGVIGGALLAVFFAYVLQHVPSPLLMIFLITLSLSVFTLLSERYRFWEYAFLQAGVMIPLILMTSSQQLINVHLALERSLGSLEGALVGVVMVYLSRLFFTKEMREQ